MTKSRHDRVASIASPLDLLATALKLILERAEAKHERDTVALFAAGWALADGLAAARALFGSHFLPAECLRAFADFEDGDWPFLDAGVRETLIEAARMVRELPLPRTIP